MIFNPYAQYYLNQQQGHGMPVFRGSSWQKGHGQMGCGLGGLFRSLTRAAMPMVKSRAKALGNIALNSGANILGDLLAGKNPKGAAKARSLEGASVTSPRWTKVPTSIFKTLFKHTVKTTNIVRVQITNYSYIKFTKGTNIKDNV